MIHAPTASARAGATHSLPVQTATQMSRRCRCAKTVPILFRALLASGQIQTCKLNGWGMCLEVGLILGIRFPASNLKLGKKLEIGVVLTACQARLPEGESATPGYGIYNVLAMWRPDEGLLTGTEFCLGIENLFNREYEELLSDGPG